MVDFEGSVKDWFSDAEVARLAAGNYSDVRDAEGHQYVDLVMEGGGMLGFALLGYTYALERCGIRFWSIAGTSAGAISAMLLAGIGGKEEPKSLRVLRHLSAFETSSFLDGDHEIRSIVEAWQEGTLDKYRLAQAILTSDSLKDLMRFSPVFDPSWLDAYKANGLFQGERFRNWVSQILSTAPTPVRSLADLRAVLAQAPPNLEVIPDPRRSVQVGELRSRLALVAADVTTESLVVFPEMASRYWANPDSVDPADFVRASMSIPFFFQPFEVTIPHEDPAIKDAWGGDPPAKAVFVDGGILSNFPIAVFHAPGSVPTHPTFGVKLNPSRRIEQSTSTPAELAGAIFNTARHSLDNDFLKKNTDYKKLVAYIDTKEIGWLDFKMSDANKLRLFSQGVAAAVKFLEQFAWPEYKNLRHDLLQLPAINLLRREAEQVEAQLQNKEEFTLMLDGHNEKVRIFHREKLANGFDATVVHGQPGEERGFSRYRMESRVIVKTYCLQTKAGNFTNFARVRLDENNQYARTDTRLPDDDTWISGILSEVEIG